MNRTIFCANNHLILDAARCAECGWTRPRPAQTGQPVWGPLALSGGLGGPGRSVLAAPAAAQGVAVFPLREGWLVGVNLNDGRERWRQTLEGGRMTRCLAADGERLALTLSDERSLERAEAGGLYALQPLTGELQPLWSAGAPLLSPPALTGQLILARTSRSELVALTRQAQPRLVWRQPLRAWWALPPYPAGESVLVCDGRAMQGEGLLLAFALADGRRVWEQPTDGLLAHPPVVSGERLVIRDGRRALACLERASGKRLWQREYARIYGNLQTANGFVYLVVRGEAPSGQPGHYLLQALDPLAEQIAWQSALPGRARALLAAPDGLLLAGDDDGRITAHDALNGEPVWEYTLGSDEDAIHSELFVVEGRMLAGTYFGRLVALQISAPPQPAIDPAELLRQGDCLGAAQNYALGGDLVKAAELYLAPLNDPLKALLLYERAGDFARAGRLALDQQMYSRAQADFHQAGDLLQEAEALAHMGDSLSAARLFEQAGDLRRAAEEYEKGGELRLALEAYARLGNSEAVARLRPFVPLSLDDVEELERAGQLEEAATAALKIGDWRKAADLAQRAGAPALELAALRRLAQEQGEAWAWERLANLARALGMFALEAEAWQQFDDPARAAEAYWKAARQAEQRAPEPRAPEQEETIAAFFERASNLFDCEGLVEECQLCRQKVIYFRRLPWVVVEGHTEKGFREGEFNAMDLEIRNVGRGVAHNVSVHSDSARFEIDQSSTIVSIPHLAPGSSKPARIFLRSQKDQVGEAVPFMLIWTWQDRKKAPFEERIITSVQVRRRSDSPSGGAPVNIHYHGAVYQSEGGQMDFVGGDKVAGDQVGGDKIAGGQKGDNVVIDRSGDASRADLSGRLNRSLRFSAGAPGEPTQAQTLCPNCSLPVAAGENFCQGCGFELKPKGKGRK